MRFSTRWSRGRCLALSGATAAQAAVGLKGLGQASGTPRNSATGNAAAGQQKYAQEAANAMPPPGVITGGVQPLMEGMTARPLRYRPVAGEFVIRNGGEFFNRPIYAPCSPTQTGDFRVDAGDRPEFSLYLPGHGGNLKLGIMAPAGVGSKWAADCDEVVARYRPGRMIYEVRDFLLGSGTLRMELLTAGEGSGLIVKIDGHGMPAGTRLAWAFGGVSGRKGRRNGDIGCEVEPVSRFFQVRAEECDGNSYVLGNATARLSSKAAELALAFPAGSRLGVEEFSAFGAAPKIVAAGTADASRKQLVLTGSVEMKSAPMYLTIDRILSGAQAGTQFGGSDPAAAFTARSAQVETIAGTLSIGTPEEYLT